MRHLPATLALAAALSACSGYASKPDTKPSKPLAEAAPATYVRPCAAPPANAEQAFECDRKSILAMAGEFRVHFAFDETAALAPGYAPHARQRSGGTELVEVIADDGRHISLQHILVLGEDHAVVKHWRQDWQYEPRHVLRFRGNGVFETESVAAGVAKGAWSQTVYDVDDAPRYGGVGRWTHDEGLDAWTSDRTWRPLPRREYTKRSDYQALEVVNRHTLTPGGWVHEQDNTKLAIAVDGTATAIAREIGVNSYTRIADYDFGAGRAYWEKTRAFWADVRARWERIADAHGRFATSPEPNGEPRIDELFALAERVEKGETVAPSEIGAVFAKYVSTR
jgi:hypothetical protein